MRHRRQQRPINQLKAFNYIRGPGPRFLMFHCGKFQFDLSRPVVMGIVNVTPDSFSDGGRYTSTAAAIAHARQLIQDGADILDIGGESTRPGAASVSEQQELERVLPVIEGCAASQFRSPSIPASRK